jgi:hypothetical protein
VSRRSDDGVFVDTGGNRHWFDSRRAKSREPSG